MSMLKALLLTFLLMLVSIGIYLGVFYATNDFEFLSGNYFGHASGLLMITTDVLSYFIVFFFFYKSIFKKKFKTLQTEFDLKIVGFLLLIVVGIEFVNRPFFDFQRMIAYFEHDTIEIYSFNYTSLNNYMFFSVLIVAPILEELFFRKYLLIELLKKYNVKISLLVSSLCFSLIHIDSPRNLIPTFIFGCVSGIIYLKSKNIRYSILLHFLSNLFWILLIVKGEVFYNWLLDFNFGIQYWLLFILGIILTIFGVKQINNHFKKNINA